MSPALFPAIFAPQGAFTSGRVNPAALVSSTKMYQAGGGKVATLIDEDVEAAQVESADAAVEKQ